MKRAYRFLGLAVISLSLLAGAPFAANASSTDNFPSKSLTIINPFSAGGGSDFICRVLADALQRNWGQTVNVVSVPGGAGATGMNQAKKARPDGYTIILSALGPAGITPNRANVGYQTPTDFRAVAKITASAYVVAVNAKSDIKDFKGLLEKAKGENSMTYGTPGAGLGQHMMFSELLSRMSEVSLQHIPFNGSTEMMGALLGQHVDVVVGVDTDILPHALSGDVRVIATASDEPSNLFPEVVPTLTSMGYKPALQGTWNGFLVPAKTPDSVVLKLQNAVVDALRDPDIIERFKKAQINLHYEDHTLFGERVRNEYETFSKLIKGMGK